MAVIMISSISQSLVNNPYNVPVTPIQKNVNTIVTPAHQASNQSNSHLNQQYAQVSSLEKLNDESQLYFNMSIHELENIVTTIAQDKINEASADIQAKKESVWQFGIQQQYIDSQKAAVNAYVVSATGESINETTDSLTNNAINEGLTDKYMSLVEQELKLKYSDISKPDIPEFPAILGDVYIQPVPETIGELANQQIINQYNSVQYQGRSSLLHLSA